MVKGRKERGEVGSLVGKEKDATAEANPVARAMSDIMMPCSVMTSVGAGVSQQLAM